MLYKHKHESGKVLVTSAPLLISPTESYVRPTQGREWFQTTTSVWRVDELIRRRVRDWKRLMGETGHDGTRSESMRKDHDSVYTSTYSVFPAPLVEWIYLRYAPEGCRILDAFAGGPPRGLVAAIMGYEYHGFDIRQEQIDENLKVLGELGLKANYHLGDGTKMKADIGDFDFGLTCPPYYDLEKYSDQEDDLSNLGTYEAFNEGMKQCASAYFSKLKPGAFLVIVVGPFRNKKTKELIDFPAHTVENFRHAGFFYHQQIILSKNFGSACQRSTNAWAGRKLVPIHEFAQVFIKPEVTSEQKRTRKKA